MGRLIENDMESYSFSEVEICRTESKTRLVILPRRYKAFSLQKSNATSTPYFRCKPEFLFDKGYR